MPNRHRTPTKHGLAAVSMLAASPFAAAQVPEVSVLAREGDVLPTGEVVTNMAEFEVGDDGTWATFLQLGTSTIFDRALVVDGSVVLKTGDTFPNGATIVSMTDLSVSRAGEVAVLLRTDNAGTQRSRVLVDGTPVVATGDLVPTPQGPLELTSVRAMDYDDGRIFLTCTLRTSTGTTEATWYGDATPSGLVDQVVNFAGDTIMGSPHAFLEGGLDVSMASTRTSAAVVLDGPSGPHDAILQSGFIVAEHGGAAPIPGSAWDFSLRARGRTNVQGRILLAGAASLSGGGTESVVALDGAIVAREGDPVPGLPAEVVGNVANASLFLADDGTVIYTVPFAGGGAATMVGEHPLIRTGQVLGAGQVVQHLNQGSLFQGFDATSDGRTLILLLDVVGGGPTLLLVERGPADPVACAAEPNSTGAPGRIEARGSRLVAENDLTITATSLPLSSFGYLLTSRTAQTTPMAGGGAGTLCLGGEIGRFVGQVQSSGATGRIRTNVDLTALPQPTGFVAGLAGETWLFQLWHRDAAGGTATSNFTEAVQVVLE